jgi:hypothetical protein
MKPTEGPWFVHDFSGIEGEVTVSCDHPATLTVAYMGSALTGTLEEKRANAKAISAVPQLLKACEMLVHATDKGAPLALLINVAAAADEARLALRWAYEEENEDD